MPGVQLPSEDPDLAGIGIESRLIPHIIAVESGVAQLTDDSNVLLKEDAQTIVDMLDKAVLMKPELKDRWIKILCKLSRSHNVRPKSCFPSGVALIGGQPRKTGGSVWEVWEGEQGGNRVCVKTFRMPKGPSLDGIKETVYGGIVQWKYISHPNVLPFLGVLEELPGLPSFCIITTWLEKGNIVEYTNNNPNVNRFQLLAQAASGLDHLHSLDIKHGSIHPGNILIIRENDVCLADFGIATIMTGSTDVQSRSMTISKPGAVRYMAPELLEPSTPRFKKKYGPSKESDVYSLAMTVFQVLSGVLPYHGTRKESVIAYKIVCGERPPRPATNQWLPDPIWEAIQQCWEKVPESRPSLDSLHQMFATSSDRLAHSSSDGNPPPPPRHSPGRDNPPPPPNQRGHRPGSDNSSPPLRHLPGRDNPPPPPNPRGHPPANDSPPPPPKQRRHTPGNSNPPQPPNQRGPPPGSDSPPPPPRHLSGRVNPPPPSNQHGYPPGSDNIPPPAVWDGRPPANNNPPPPPIRDEHPPNSDSPPPPPIRDGHPPSSDNSTPPPIQRRHPLGSSNPPQPPNRRGPPPGSDSPPPPPRHLSGRDSPPPPSNQHGYPPGSDNILPPPVRDGRPPVRDSPPVAPIQRGYPPGSGNPPPPPNQRKYPSGISSLPPPLVRRWRSLGSDRLPPPLDRRRYSLGSNNPPPPLDRRGHTPGSGNPPPPPAQDRHPPGSENPPPHNQRRYTLGSGNPPPPPNQRGHSQGRGNRTSEKSASLLTRVKNFCCFC